MQLNDKKSKFNLFKCALGDMADFPKKLLKYSAPVALGLTILGTALFIYNKTSLDYTEQLNVTSMTLINNSFFVLGEYLIAAFVSDIIIKKRNG